MNQIIRPRDESTGHARKSIRVAHTTSMGYEATSQDGLSRVTPKGSRTVLRGRGHREVPKLPGAESDGRYL